MKFKYVIKIGLYMIDENKLQVLEAFLLYCLYNEKKINILIFFKKIQT